MTSTIYSSSSAASTTTTGPTARSKERPRLRPFTPQPQPVPSTDHCLHRYSCPDTPSTVKPDGSSWRPTTSTSAYGGPATRATASATASTTSSSAATAWSGHSLSTPPASTNLATRTPQAIAPESIGRSSCRDRVCQKV